ncbi:TVP38/TMEM64 family protein [Patescibacteria group bacterium]
MEEIILQMENYVLSVGPWGPFVYILMMTIAIVISPIPSSPLAIFAGTVFGTWWGGLWTLIGAIIGAMIAFYIARIFGRPMVLKFISEKKIAKIEKRFSEGNLIITVFLLRLLPLPFFDAVSYAAGLTHISVRGFVGATVIGLMPLSFLFSYAGELLSENIFAFTILMTVFFLVLAIFFKIYNNQTKNHDSTKKDK